MLKLGRRVADLILQKGYRQTRTERMKTYALLLSALLASQTVVTPPENKYTPAQDVELGRSAAAARHSFVSAANSSTMPISRDRTSWRAPATIRATWPTCSRRSKSRADRAGRSG